VRFKLGLGAPSEMDGDSLSYMDMMERSIVEEKRRQRERIIMQEGQALWQAKKHDQLELEIKEQEEVIDNFKPVLSVFFKTVDSNVFCWWIFCASARRWNKTSFGFLFPIGIAVVFDKVDAPWTGAVPGDFFELFKTLFLCKSHSLFVQYWGFGSLFWNSLMHCLAKRRAPQK
jgi:hypothetical protein